MLTDIILVYAYIPRVFDLMIRSKRHPIKTLTEFYYLVWCRSCLEHPHYAARLSKR